MINKRNRIRQYISNNTNIPYETYDLWYSRVLYTMDHEAVQLGQTNTYTRSLEARV